MTNQLTEKELKVFSALCLFVREHVKPPSLTQLAESVGFARGSTHKYLVDLEKKGYIGRGDHSMKELVILKNLPFEQENYTEQPDDLSPGCYCCDDPKKEGVLIRFFSWLLN